MNKKTLELIKKELIENLPFFPESSEYLKKLENKSKDKFDPDLEKDVFVFLTTIRSRNLISDAEQKKIQKTVVAFFGLSVGSHAVTSWMMISRAQNVKISDPDTLSMSNLNRLKYGLKALGKAKTDLVANDLKTINPYCNIYAYRTIGEETIKKIMFDNPKPNVIVDEMDDLESKLLIRKYAKEMEIPVIMATDVGDNVFLEVERYDISRSIKYFNGRVGSLNHLDVGKLNPKEKMKIMFDIVGLEDNSERMLESLTSIGKKIKTWPQLGSTAAISGGIVATTIKKIVMNAKVKSGRYKILLENMLESDYESVDRVSKRKKIIETILQP